MKTAKKPLRVVAGLARNIVHKAVLKKGSNSSAKKQELFVTPRKVSASTCRQFRTRRICRTGTGPQPGQKTPLDINRIKRNRFIKKMMDELPLDINSPCTCQSLAYTPSCQHQQSLPSRSILAGEESSGEELFVWQVNFHKSRVANKGNLELLKESLIFISSKVLWEKIDELVSIKPRRMNLDHNAEKARYY